MPEPRSRGPVTSDGKARASRNALTHGMCAMQHLVVTGEIPAHLDELVATLVEETGTVGEIEIRLARRLAAPSGSRWPCSTRRRLPA